GHRQAEDDERGRNAMTTRMSIFALLFAAAGCSPMVPRELAEARATYYRAASGPASQMAPAEVHKAKESLELAERVFADNPESQSVRDFSYVAIRKAELAEAHADALISKQQKDEAEQELRKRQGMALDQARGQIAEQGEQLKQTEQQIAKERQARGQ